MYRSINLLGSSRHSVAFISISHSLLIWSPCLAILACLRWSRWSNYARLHMLRMKGDHRILFVQVCGVFNMPSYGSPQCRHLCYNADCSILFPFNAKSLARKQYVPLLRWLVSPGLGFEPMTYRTQGEQCTTATGAALLYVYIYLLPLKYLSIHSCLIHRYLILWITNLLILLQTIERHSNTKNIEVIQKNICS